jgi:prephenate dehydrogenase
MKISVIGGAGQMGKWLIQHFMSLGHTVIASDSRKNELQNVANTLGVFSENSNTTAVVDSDVVIISVPIDQTAGVIREVSPHMKQNSVLCEISSIKQNLPDVLMDASDNRLRPLCIHPMFGPGPGSSGRPIVLIPIHDMQTERSLVRELFPGHRVISTTVNEHDRAMAFIISLPYFVNTIFASVLAEEDLALLQQLAGTTFTIQFLLIGGILFQSSNLHITLHKENKHLSDILSHFQAKLVQGISLLADDISGFREFYEKVKKDVGQKVNLQEKYEEMYRVLKIMKDVERGEGGF